MQHIPRSISQSIRYTTLIEDIAAILESTCQSSVVGRLDEESNKMSTAQAFLAGYCSNVKGNVMALRS